MKEYKSILIVLVKFFAIYLVLIGLYYLYLNYYQNKLQTCDPYTRIVGEHSASLLQKLNFDSKAIHLNQDNYMIFTLNNKKASIVNEGCNAFSVIILYISFIIAFASTWKKTILYIFITTVIIYIANIIRVATLNYIFHYYNEYSKIAHDYFFPAIIYGLIIILWLIWIKFFVLKKEQPNAKST